MPHSAPQPDNVSRDEMRAALARGGARPPRRAPLTGYDAPAWDWTTGESETQVQDLREEIARLESQLDSERTEQRLARAREEELRSGLRELATVSVFRRRRVVAELAARRLLPPR